MSKFVALICAIVMAGCARPSGDELGPYADASTGNQIVPDTGDSETGACDECTSSGSDDGSGLHVCTGNQDCPDVESPYCSEDGLCVSCDRAPVGDGDVACAQVDATTPACTIDGTCMPCREGVTQECDKDNLVCDTADNVCANCTKHSECDTDDGRGACQLAAPRSGECFPPESVRVTLDADDQLQNSIDSIPLGGHGITLMRTTSSEYSGATISGNRTIALLAELDESPEVRGDLGPALLVQGRGATLYVDGVDFVNTVGGLGLEIDGATAWMDRSRIVQNSSGGVLAQKGANLTLRNCFVGGEVADTDAVVIDGSTLQMTYTTVVAGGGLAESRALFCSGTVAALIRNSILVAVDDGNLELLCSMADVEYSVTEAVTPGTGNVSLGDLQLGWFISLENDFHLDTMAPRPIATAAQWQAGDPSTDIDGALRPTMGTSDYAGADVP